MVTPDKRMHTMTLARAYFRSIDLGGNGQLWVTDGTAAGTMQLATPAGSSNGIYPGSFARLGDAIFFQGNTPTRSTLFRLDAVTNAVAEFPVAFARASSGLSPDYLTTVNGTLYFSGYDASGYSTLWKSDGTSARTMEVPIAGLSGASYYPGHLTAFGNRLAFEGSPVTTSDNLVHHRRDRPRHVQGAGAGRIVLRAHAPQHRLDRHAPRDQRRQRGLQERPVGVGRHVDRHGAAGRAGAEPWRLLQRPAGRAAVVRREPGRVHRL